MSKFTLCQKPILFNDEMVRAIIDGRKTETRRPNRPIPWQPYYVGNILYVRETWGIDDTCDTPQYVYRATSPEWKTLQTGFKWKPSIHMPRCAARIFLEVVDVRKERIQDITEAGAIAEGIEPDGCGCAVNNFKKLWMKLYGDNAWNFNLYTWVIKFKKVEA